MTVSAKQRHPADFERLTEETRRLIHEGEYDPARIDEFWRFHDRIGEEVLKHRIITDNPFTPWFEKGEFTPAQARTFVQQFSVFSNEFLVAQLRKMLNADSLEEMRASKEILANEIGVTFKGGTNLSGGENELGDLEGSVNGGIFRFRAAHFELLYRMAEHLGLEFKDLGKRRFGTESTLFFCDELIRLYGSEDYATATAASFAVENWAAAGFWDELVRGWNIFKERECPELPLIFFTWHAKIEANHAQHTQAELEEYFFTNEVDQNRFIRDANEMLDGVYEFWRGLTEAV
ncbi:MAG: hypothetical protein HUJ31_15875 [Pseudomonadales bacterium]|nr:hypothetical protein [Pseudomonadales bacterium]